LATDISALLSARVFSPLLTEGDPPSIAGEPLPSRLHGEPRPMDHTLSHQRKPIHSHPSGRLGAAHSWARNDAYFRNGGKQQDSTHS
jgi:hypothetical protein